MRKLLAKPLFFLGCAVIAAAANGCSGSPDGSCLTNAECSVPGETCDTLAATCGCDPAAATDQCTTADATTACHTDDKKCVKTCAADTDCGTAGQKCDLSKKVCRDASKITAVDCTLPANACATDKVCDPATKACAAPCTSTSCGTGLACNTGTKLCAPDCTVPGNLCTAGTQVCDSTAKVCVAKCGEDTCKNGQICSSTGFCQNRCDAETDPSSCPPDTVCDIAAAGNTGDCLADCRVTATICDETEFCGPAGHCKSKCTSTASCGNADLFCRLDDSDATKNGRCENKIQSIAECAKPSQQTPRSYLVAAENRCKPVTAIGACAAAANRDAGKTVSDFGPTAFEGLFVAKVRSTVDACKSGAGVFGWIYQYNVAYYDYEKDFPTTGLYSKVWVALENADTNTYSPVKLVAGSNAETGVLTFELCRPVGASAESFAIYMADSNDYYGNSVCIDSPADEQ